MLRRPDHCDDGPVGDHLGKATSPEAKDSTTTRADVRAAWWARAEEVVDDVDAMIRRAITGPEGPDGPSVAGPGGGPVMPSPQEIAAFIWRRDGGLTESRKSVNRADVLAHVIDVCPFGVPDLAAAEALTGAVLAVDGEAVALPVATREAPTVARARGLFPGVRAGRHAVSPGPGIGGSLTWVHVGRAAAAVTRRRSRDEAADDRLAWEGHRPPSARRRELRRLGPQQPMAWSDSFGDGESGAVRLSPARWTVRYALKLAGFHVVDQADDSTPGLRVSEAPAGVLVSWTTSHGFTALAADQPGAWSDGMRVVVQAAVAGLLVQRGHTVAETLDGNGIVVLAEGSAAGP
ncbi:hypothetical protein [Streptomyces glomeratus]|uniref:Uncharacterized protein n=1 Tax=Streptomyces glomeratus TaxID=284452 RepID=A0ABP6LR07_9ACTN|nr:hypothetical protein [Streptomyces glomeratus]MCF1512689.1 hypothetical protein [Streptomyces glomeratus]